MKVTTSQRLKQLLSERNLKQVDVLALAQPISEKYGVKLTKSGLSQYVSGKVEPGQEKLTVLGKALDVSEVWLMGYDVPQSRKPVTENRDVPAGFEPLPEMTTIPLVGTIACGTPITAEENIEARIGIPAAWNADFALTCKGDSMAPRYLDGDVVCIRCQPEVENGQIAAVRIGEEATLKRFYQEGDTVTLVPVNPAYTPLVYRGAELNDIQIEGRVVGFCRGE